MEVQYSNLNNVVLFDGVCNLCNGSVDFIVKHEKGNELLFASLQSDIGKDIVAHFELSYIPDSILYYSESQLFMKSTAVLRISEELKLPYRWVIMFSFLPESFRDSIYDWIARNRYRWFGKKETCRIPTDQERSKFLG
jgi:predicted DCC family thiol-disulfide oxidoreductase YuxK